MIHFNQTYKKMEEDLLEPEALQSYAGIEISRYLISWTLCRVLPRQTGTALR